MLQRLRGPPGQRLLAAFDTAEASPLPPHSIDLAGRPAPAMPPQPLGIEVPSNPTASAVESDGPISYRSMSTAEAGCHDEQHTSSGSKLAGTSVQTSSAAHHESLEAAAGDTEPQVERPSTTMEAGVDKCGSGSTEQTAPVSKQYDMAFAQEVRFTWHLH